MKKIGLFFLFIFLNLSSSADKVKSFICIWSRNNSCAAYVLSESPRLSFSSSDLVIKISNDEIYYPLAELKKISYEPFSTSIEANISDKGAFNKEGDLLIFNDLPYNSKISIFTLNGTLLLNKAIKEERNYSFSLYSLPMGIYLIKVNNQTFKILKK